MFQQMLGVSDTSLVSSGWLVPGVTVGTCDALTQRQHDFLAEILYSQGCNSHCYHARAVATGAAQNA